MVGTAPPKLSLSADLAAELMSRAGIHGPWTVTALQRSSHAFLIQGLGGSFFLKAPTKSSYPLDSDRGPALAVRHETAAWECLRRHGLAIPEVIAADESTDNALGWPYVVSRGLTGLPAGPLVEAAGLVRAGAVLEALGDYLRRMHAISFRDAGYVMTADGPDQPLDAREWDHACHSADGWQRSALRGLESRGLSEDVRSEVERRCSVMAEQIRWEFEPPRFTQGDSRASHYFVDLRGGAHVTGVVDMEVASSGDPVYDLILIAIELMARLDARTRWWEPFFAGYGDAPDLERFRLGLLATDEPNFKAHGPERWPATLEQTYRALIAASTWDELFSANRPPD